MRRTLNQFLLAAALSAGGFSLAGCKQDAGERCEVDSDCVAPLVCDTKGDQTSGHCSVTRQGDGTPIPDASRSETGAPVPPDGGGGAAEASPGSDAPGNDAPDAEVTVNPDAPAEVGADASSDLRPDATAATPDTSSGG